MLPQAPTSAEKNLYLDPKRGQLYIIGLFSTAVLITGNLLFIYHNPSFFPYLFFLTLLAFYLGISYFIGVMGHNFDNEAHQRLLARWIDKVDGHSLVDIYLPVCGEPLPLLHNTWMHVSALAYAQGSCRVYVLDDKRDPAVKNLADTFRFNYIARETNELKKAGNLRHAFERTEGEYIVIFDADFCPRTDFLLNTLPYMYEDPRIGIVQTPQYFRVHRDQNWLERGAAAVQELFYRLIQVNRNTFNGAICVGTCALYRRASLAPFGGTAPIEYSEDVHTGFQIVSTGGKIAYIPINLAAGVCPSQLNSYYLQQYRWSMGSISLFFSKKFWAGNINPLQIICYLSGMLYYMTTGLFVVVGALPSFLMLLFYPEKIFWFNLLASVPSALYSTLYMCAWTSLAAGSLRWRTVIDALSARWVAYFAHLFATVDYLRGNLEAWQPTNGKVKSSRYDLFKKLFVVHTIGIPTLLIGLVCYRIAQGYAAENFILLLLFTGFNFYISFNPLKDILRR